MSPPHDVSAMKKNMVRQKLTKKGDVVGIPGSRILMPFRTVFFMDIFHTRTGVAIVWHYGNGCFGGESRSNAIRIDIRFLLFFVYINLLLMQLLLCV